MKYQFVSKHQSWLQNDYRPHFYGSQRRACGDKPEAADEQ